MCLYACVSNAYVYIYAIADSHVADLFQRIKGTGTLHFPNRITKLFMEEISTQYSPQRVHLRETDYTVRQRDVLRRWRRRQRERFRGGYLFVNAIKEKYLWAVPFICLILHLERLSRFSSSICIRIFGQFLTIIRVVIRLRRHRALPNNQPFLPCFGLYSSVDNLNALGGNFIQRF